MRLRRLCTWLALGAVVMLNSGCFFHRCGCRRFSLFHRHCEPACHAPSCCGYEPGWGAASPPLAPPPPLPAPTPVAPAN